MVAPARANTMALDFTNLHTAQAKRRSASSALVGLRRVGTVSSPAGSPARSRDCANPCATPGRLAVQRRALVRIFPVTQVLHLLEHQRQGRGERLARGRLLWAEVGGDPGVVVGGRGEGLGGEAGARG